MVEVTLQMTEDELKSFIRKEFNSIGKFDASSEDLYLQYFDTIVDNGSATLFFGPVHLRTWILETLDRLSIVTPLSENYNEVKELWETKEYENNQLSVVAHNRTDYLVEWY